MKDPKTLEDLSNEDLQENPAWQVTGEQDEAGNDLLAPSPLIDHEVVPGSVAEVWCLCKSKFRDGSEHLAIAMCRGDSEEGPLAISIWNGEAHIPLLVPPAPPFVLERQGPEVFAKSFGRTLQAVFPLTVEVVPRFSTRPQRRAVSVDTTGVISQS